MNKNGIVDEAIHLLSRLTKKPQPEVRLLCGRDIEKMVDKLMAEPKKKG